MKETRDNMDEEETLQVNQSTITVAEILRTSREKSGQDLRSVANVLRIRYVFLEAIERGDFDCLPGDTYAYGFVRTYAEHLDLNKDEIVRQFKEEVNNYGNTRELVFPTPVPESKTPGLAIIIISILLLAVAYGGWAAVSRFDVNIPDWVPFLSEVNSEGSVETPAETSSQAVVETADISATGVTSNTVTSASKEVVEVVSSESLSSGTEAPTTETLITETPTASSVTIETTAVAGPKPQTSVEETVAASVPSISTAAVVEGSNAAEVATTTNVSDETKAKVIETSVTTASTVVTPPPPPEPKVFGDEGGISPISIVAESDTWMHIVDATGDTVFSRVLRAGSVYNVPQREGLVMTTGNAGGITLKLNGQALPKLGSLGDVRRGILLSEEGLRNSILSE